MNAEVDNSVGFICACYILNVMKYVIQINTSPGTSHLGRVAIRFIQTLYQQGHEVLRVFFYREGVHHAFKYALPPQDEVSVQQQWSRLAKDRNIDMVVCISAAQRRALLHEDEAARVGKTELDIAEGFRIAGLGQLIDAQLHADRFIEF